MITIEPAAFFSGLEWVMLTLALTGVIACGYGVREGYLDRKAVILSGINHGRRAAANRNLRRDAALLVYMLLTVWVNVTGVLAPPTPSQVNPSMQTWVLYGGEIVKIVMLMLLSVFGQIEYFHIRHKEH